MCNLLITDNYSLFILNVVASAQWILYQLPFTTIENGAFTIILHKGYTSMGFYAFQKQKKTKKKHGVLWGKLMKMWVKVFLAILLILLTIFQASSFGLIGNLYGPEMFEINIQMG